MARITICTEALTGEFCKLIRMGNYFETVCDYLGIDKGSAYNWIKWGREGKDATGEDTSAYREFFNAFTQAEAEAEITSVQDLKAAGHARKLPAPLLDKDGKPVPGVQFGDWRATAEFLARRYPARWSPNARTQMELTGADGGPVKTEHAGRIELTGDAALAVLAYHESKDPEPEVDGLHTAQADAEASGIPEPE